MASDKTIEEIENLTKAKQKGTITDKEYAEAIRKSMSAMKGLYEATKEVNAQTVQLAANEARINEIMGDSLSAYESNLEVLKQFKQITGDAYEATDKLDEATRKKIEAAGLDADAMIAQANAAKAYKDKIDSLGPAYKEALKVSKPFFEDTATKLGLLSKSGNKFVKKLTKMGKLATQPGGLKGLAKGLTETFNPLNIGISILSKVVEQTIKMMFAVDKAGAAFTKTTGFSRDFDVAIASTNDRLRQFGVSADDAQKATVSLRKSLSNFTVLSGQTQQGLIDVVSSLNEIGVSTEDSSQTILSLTKSFDISADAAGEMTRELAMSGNVLGKTASQMTKDYNKTLSVLAVYGSKSVKIFKDIAAQASAAGVEVDTMMGIANKFDTFADSAKTAAKMNAILGTSFSGNNLMMMDHDKRITHVIKGIQKTGVAFKNLDKFTQQAIANQLNIKNLDEARRILGMNVGEYKRMQKEQAKEAKNQKALQDRMKAGLDVMEKIKLIFADFAVNLQKNGMIETIKGIVDGLGKFLIWLKDVNPWMIAGTGLLLSLGGALWNMLQMAGSIRIFGAVSGKTIEGLGKSVASAITQIGTAGSASSVGITSLSISMGGVALVIGTAAASIALITFSLAYLFKTMIQGIVLLKQVGAGFGDVALGIFAMVGSVAALSAAIVALGFAAKGLEKSKFGMALGGILAATMGATLGVGMLMSTSKDKAKPEMDMDELTKSAEKIGDLATKLQDLRDNKEALQETFAAIGKGLESGKNALNAQLESTIANIAVITTGHASGEMTNYAMAFGLGAVMAAIEGIGAAKDKNKTTENGKVIKIQLDGKATTDLFNGLVASAHVKP